MNVFQLECFVTLSHSSTFHAAAEKLYVSQSSFSNNIQTLEQELGVDLITRSNRGFSLTDAGRSLLSYANRIVGEHDHMNDLLLELKKEQKNQVLFFAEPMTSFGYNELLTSFWHYAPEITIEISEMESGSTLKLLNQYDNAICVEFSSGGVAEPGTVRYPIHRGNLSMLVNRSHFLADRETVELSELSGRRIDVILPKHSKYLYEFALAQLEKAGVTANVSRHMLWYSCMTEAVKTQGYAAIIPDRTAEIFCDGDMRTVRIDGAEQYGIDMVVSSSCESSAVHRLLKYVTGLIA